MNRTLSNQRNPTIPAGHPTAITTRRRAGLCLVQNHRHGESVRHRLLHHLRDETRRILCDSSPHSPDNSILISRCDKCIKTIEPPFQCHCTPPSPAGSTCRRSSRSIRRDMSDKTNTIFIMGVSGCGKSTIGEAVARKIGWNFKDGDSFHPPENVAKMRSGIPLDDVDRLPWLQTINLFARAHRRHVIACSSLKKSYRKVLADGTNSTFFLLNVKREILEKRVAERTGHFMAASLLDSQLKTLEMPERDELSVVVVEVESDDVDKIAVTIQNHFLATEKR